MDRARQTDLLTRPAATSRRGKRVTAAARRSPNIKRERCTSLSLVVTGDQPPTEFRIFTAGEVETTKGTFTFDDAAAQSVMADYAAHGIDLMIDYDHAALSEMPVDPALSGKAAGWFNIELRAGELWAVNVRWTEPAADALRRKEWRFMSPAFQTEDGRVCSLMNVAITNLPATRQLQPLMAASVTRLGENAMTLEEFMKVCKALGLDMTMSLDDAMAKIKGEPTADPDANTEDAAPPVGDGGADETTEAGGAPPPPPPAADDKKKDAPAAVAASVAKMMRLSGSTTFTDLLAKFELYRESHMTLASKLAKIAEETAILENAERMKLTAERVTLAARPPAAVWENEKCLAPKGYFATMPIADYRAMCADEIKANAGGRPAAPPTGGNGKVAVAGTSVTLTADQARICKETGCDPAVFATLTAQRDSVKSTGGI